MHCFGDAQRETPMGNLACLPWLKLEGAEWGAAALTFKCTGTMKGFTCSSPKGHGRVDLAKAIQVGCDVSLLAWANLSAVGWRKDYGEGASRARLEDVFAPFLGQRMPPGEDLPEMNPSWVGAGTLLRSSPDGLLTWLLDPAQDELVRRVRRLALNTIQENFQPEAWWILVNAAPVPIGSGRSCLWAVGGNGSLLAVLRLPDGKTRADGLARFHAIMMMPVK